jgi:hypothetical protein
MWHLMACDFWGIGVSYLGIALLLVALDCAAVGLKFLSHGNAYERAEAREARGLEHEAVIGYEQSLKDVRRYAEATSRVMAEGIGKASRDEQLNDVAIERARTRLYDTVLGSSPPPLPPVPLIGRHPAATRSRDVDRLRA